MFSSFFLHRPAPQDFRNLCVILEWLAWSDPTLDFRKLLVEWAKESLKELDFTMEAGA